MKTFSSWDNMGFVLKSLFGLEKLSPKSQMSGVRGGHNLGLINRIIRIINDK